MQLQLWDNYTGTLEELHGKVDDCQECPYHLTNDSRVNGEGASSPDIMIIGQGPGPTEVSMGRPYVGASGRLLRKILGHKDVGITRVYYSNLIRCIQPDSKSIMSKAIRMCMQWLDDEVGLVRPKVIVCLGGLATEHILGVGPISDHLGQVLDSKYGIPGVPMYHTAYFLRVKKADPDEYARMANESLARWIGIRELCGH